MGSAADDVEKPEPVTFDLDPGDGVNWATMPRRGLRCARCSTPSASTAGQDQWRQGIPRVVPIARRSTGTTFPTSRARWLSVSRRRRRNDSCRCRQRRSGPARYSSTGCATRGAQRRSPHGRCARAAPAPACRSRSLVTTGRRHRRRPLRHPVADERAPPGRCWKDTMRRNTVDEEGDCAGEGRMRDEG